VAEVLWGTVKPRVLANAAKLPLLNLAHALDALRRHGHLECSDAAGQVVKALARHAETLAKFAKAGSTPDDLGLQMRSGRREGRHSASAGGDVQRVLGPLLHCCRTLLTSLKASRPEAAVPWAGRLHGSLSRRLPHVLSGAAPSQIIPWLELYAEQGLVDDKHLAVWEAAGLALHQALLSREEELRIRRLQDRVPLWAGEFLPELAAVGGEEGWQDSSPAVVLFGEGEDALVALESLPSTWLKPSAASKPARSGKAPPMYQTTPPVPVLWHVSSEAYQKGLSRLGAAQLVLALRYVATDGAGLATRSLAAAKDPTASAALVAATGSWPRKHKSRSRARLFVGALLERLQQRLGRVSPAEACSVVRSLASLQSASLAPGREAASTLQALLAGPLAGWKVPAALSPRDIALLLDGLSSLAEEGEVDSDDMELKDAAQDAVSSGAAALLGLASCALREAAAPPSALRNLCSSAERIAGSVAGSVAGSGVQGGPELRSAFLEFLRAAAPRAAEGRGPVRLQRPLAVLRVASASQLWSSNAFPVLAPAVTAAIYGMPQVQNWPLLPGAQNSSRRRWGEGGSSSSRGTPLPFSEEELLEAAKLYAHASACRPLEGPLAVSLSLALLSRIPSLALSSAALSSFAADAAFVLRCSAAVAPNSNNNMATTRLLPLAGLRPSSDGERGNRLQSMVERFELQVHLEAELSQTFLRRWRRTQIPQASEASGLRARRRAGLAISSPGRSEKDVFAAYSALAVFRSCAPLTRLSALPLGIENCILRAFLGSDEGGGDGGRMRSLLRSCLRSTRCSERSSQALLPGGDPPLALPAPSFWDGNQKSRRKATETQPAERKTVFM
ncbi:unnamed protein product, partial [Polarella glacialis]